MKWNKWWTTGLVLVLIAGGGGGYWWWSHKQDNKPLQAALQTTQVRRGNLEATISGTGNIETVNRETLKASSAGKIATVAVKQGDNVKKGQVLATFEQDDSSSTSKETQIRSKQLDLKKKQLDLDNLQKQFKEASDDDKRAELSISIQKQQLDIESAQEDIASLQEDEEDSLDPITAPIDGTLATLSLAVGDTIGGQNGGSSSSLGEVVDYDHLQIVVGVDELDISKVKLDQPATILVEALPNQAFTGKVTSIAQEGQATSGVASFDVTVVLDDVTNLKAGMSAEATIIVDQKSDALYLPIEAVQSFGNQYFVMVPSTETAGEGNGATAGQGGGTSQGGNSAPSGSPAPDSSASPRGSQTPGSGSTAPGSSGSSAGGGRSARSGQFAGNASRQNRMPGAGAQSGVKMVSVEVGMHNEDFIEIVSGLQLGDAVVVPTVAGSSSQNASGAGGFGGAFGGGGFPGGGTFVGGGGFPGGGAFTGGGGGGGFNRTSGAATNRSTARGAQGGGSR